MGGLLAAGDRAPHAAGVLRRDAYRVQPEPGQGTGGPGGVGEHGPYLVRPLGRGRLAVLGEQRQVAAVGGRVVDQRAQVEQLEVQVVGGEQGQRVGGDDRDGAVAGGPGQERDVLASGAGGDAVRGDAPAPAADRHRVTGDQGDHVVFEALLRGAGFGGRLRCGERR